MQTPPAHGHQMLTFLFLLDDSTLWLPSLLLAPRQVNNTRRGRSTRAAAVAAPALDPSRRRTRLLTLNRNAVALDRQDRNANIPTKHLANIPRALFRPFLSRNQQGGLQNEAEGGGNVFFFYRSGVSGYHGSSV